MTTTIPAPTTTPYPSECQSARNLTEYWRKDHNGSNIAPFNGSVNCHNRDMENAGRPWFRFTGAAGSRLLDHCIYSDNSARSSCGTHLAMWSNEKMPTDIGISHSFNVYSSYDGNCKRDILQCSVMRCSSRQHDFIYKWELNPGKSYGCSYGFCGMD